MKHVALPLTLLAAFFVSFFPACSHVPPGAVAPPAGTLPAATAPVHDYGPASHLIVGYILEIDEARGFALVDLTADPLPPQLRPGTELVVRTRDLQKTAHLAASRFLRRRTLGTTILTGLPAVGEEVVLGVP